MSHSTLSVPPLEVMVVLVWQRMWNLSMMIPTSACLQLGFVLMHAGRPYTDLRVQLVLRMMSIRAVHDLFCIEYMSVSAYR